MPCGQGDSSGTGCARGDGVPHQIIKRHEFYISRQAVKIKFRGAIRIVRRTFPSVTSATLPKAFPLSHFFSYPDSQVWEYQNFPS